MNQRIDNETPTWRGIELPPDIVKAIDTFLDWAHVKEMNPGCDCEICQAGKEHLKVANKLEELRQEVEGK